MQTSNHFDNCAIRLVSNASVRGRSVLWRDGCWNLMRLGQGRSGSLSCELYWNVELHTCLLYDGWNRSRSKGQPGTGCPRTHL